MFDLRNTATKYAHRNLCTKFRPYLINTVKVYRQMCRKTHWQTDRHETICILVSFPFPTSDSSVSSLEICCSLLSDWVCRYTACSAACRAFWIISHFSRSHWSFSATNCNVRQSQIKVNKSTKTISPFCWKRDISNDSGDFVYYNTIYFFLNDKVYDSEVS